MKSFIAVCLGALLLLQAPLVLAADASSHPARSAVICPICGRANQPNADYPTKAGATLTRGLTNTLLGWTELFRRPVEEVKTGGNVVNGMGKGVGYSVQRTLSGLGEVLTFWTPKVQGTYVRFSDDCPVCMGKQPAAAPR